MQSKGLIISDERERLIKSFYVYDVPYPFQKLILEALISDEWDVLQMDGCTGVADFWPNKFAPPCLVHDYLWTTGRGGYWSDQIFYYLNLYYGFPKYKSKLRYWGVRLGWFLYFKKKHFSRGNVKPYTDNMEYCIKHIKKAYLSTKK